MTLRSRLAIVVAAVSTVAVATASPAVADTPTFQMVGFAGGSIVRSLNGTVTSALTAASSVEGPLFQADANNAASTQIANLLSSGSVSTSTQSFRVPGGVEVLSHAVTRGLSMLGGAIKANAVYTTATAVYTDGLVKSDAWSTYVGLHIAGRKLPTNIPANFQINIPNIAAVVLNQQSSVTQAGAVMVQGAGVSATLLEPRGANNIGAEILVSPSYAAVQLLNPATTHQVAGTAYGSAIYAGVGQIHDVASAPTAVATLPTLGNSGITRYTTIPAGNLAPLLQFGAVTDSATGTVTATVLDSRLTSQIAGLNLFNGLIRVDAIAVNAHAHSGIDATGKLISPFVEGSVTLANLFINGKAFAITSVRPNTVINVLNFGTITIDQQAVTPTGILVRALDIKLSTAQAGLPVGAELQIGTAVASVQ